MAQKHKNCGSCGEPRKILARGMCSRCYHRMYRAAKKKVKSTERTKPVVDAEEVNEGNDEPYHSEWNFEEFCGDVEPGFLQFVENLNIEQESDQRR